MIVQAIVRVGDASLKEFDNGIKCKEQFNKPA